MSIRFKFRSCAKFDSVDIDGRASVSLRELRLMIARQKKLNIGHDFDVIFFDALSGQEYGDENFQIESGSSVILKRVPPGMMPSTINNRPPIGTMKDLGLKDVERINHMDGQVNDFHDFGADIFPVAEGIFPNIDIGFGHKNCWNLEKENLSGPRFQYQKLDSRGLNQSIQRGSNHSNVPTRLPEPKTPDAPTLHRVIRSNFPAVPHNVLPVELKCSLCNTFFKDAVMMPCCQYSFCEKCIRLALLEKAKCPKCSSSRYRVDDLLPNLSLRQAIEHFLVSQMVSTESENALRRYVPDGESGIQVKDIPCAVTVVQRAPEMPHSPSATGKGSNQVMAEPCYDSLAKEKSLSRKMQQIDGGRGRYANHQNFPNVCRGESKPLNLLHSHVQDEVDSSIKKNSALWSDTRGGNMNFLPAGRVKKDHLIRECALASNPNPMLQTGNLMPMGGFSAYRSPFWINNTHSTPRLFATSTPRPFANMYGNAPFNASMIPQTPILPPYMRSTHAGMPLRGEIMRMGGMALPDGNRDDLPFNHYEYTSLQLAEDKRRIQNEKIGSFPMPMGGFSAYRSPFWINNTHSTPRLFATSTPRPFANMYGNAPFNASMIPQAPILPPCMRSTHAGMPLRGEIMRMGGMALPDGNRDDLPFNHYEYTSLQLAEDKRRIQNEKIGRGRYFQAEPNFKEHCPKNDREATGKFHKEREPCKSRSDNSFARKMHRKHLHVEKRREKSRRSSSARRDKMTRHSDRCNDGFPSSSDKRRRGSHQHCSQDPRKCYECDSTLGHCEVSDRKRGVNCHERGSQLKDHPSSAVEPSSPVHQTARSKERRGFGHDAKHSRHHARHSTDDIRDNKERMSSGSSEDCRDGYHHKRKRDH